MALFSLNVNFFSARLLQSLQESVGQWHAKMISWQNVSLTPLVWSCTRGNWFRMCLSAVSLVSLDVSLYNRCLVMWCCSMQMMWPVQCTCALISIDLMLVEFPWFKISRLMMQSSSVIPSMEWRTCVKVFQFLDVLMVLSPLHIHRREKGRPLHCIYIYIYCMMNNPLVA